MSSSLPPRGVQNDRTWELCVRQSFKASIVEPEAVSEKGVLYLFGQDGMLVIQYDATLVPADVAKSIVSEMQKYEQQRAG